MDAHARWLRREVLKRLLTMLSLTLTVVSGVATAILLGGGMSWDKAVPWAVLLGETFVLAEVAIGLLAGVLSRGYVSRFVEQSMIFTSESLTLSERPELQQRLEHLGFGPVARLVVGDGRVGDGVVGDGVAGDGVAGDGVAGDEGAVPTQRHEVFATAGKCTFVAHSVNSGAAVVVSQLSDGRYLVTSDLLVAPHELLVVNFRPSAGTERLIRDHASALVALGRRNSPAIAASPAVIAAVLRLEQAAYRQIGPWIAPFLALGPKRNPFGPSVFIAPAALRRLAGRSQRLPVGIDVLHDGAMTVSGVPS